LEKRHFYLPENRLPAFDFDGRRIYPLLIEILLSFKPGIYFYEERKAMTRLTVVLYSLVVMLLGIQQVSADDARTETSSIPAKLQPMSIMIQPSTWWGKPADLKNMLEYICAHHRRGGSGTLIQNLVLNDVAVEKNGRAELLTDLMDVIAPYLPGTPVTGDSSCKFDNAFIGTIFLPYPGELGSPYREGIQDRAFTARNVELSLQAANAFKHRYPDAFIHWYITYEAGLTAFYDKNVSSAYKTYLTDLITALNTVYPGRAFEWSPAFLNPYWFEETGPNAESFFKKLTTNLQDVVDSIPTRRLWLNIQDKIGGSGANSLDCQHPHSIYKEDALKWYNYVKRNISGLASLAMNVEQFQVATCDAANGLQLRAADKDEIYERTKFYSDNGVQLGAAWELRFWMDIHRN